MPWQETNVLEQRIEFIAAARQAGANRRALCRQFGISPPTAYKWLARTEIEGIVGGLRDRSRRPHRSPRRLAPEVTAAVIALRRQYGWAGRKLQPLLAEAGYHIAPATIDRIIQRAGLTDLDEAHRPAPHRFVRAHPNELWQMDFKGQYPVRTGWSHPLSILDDHSRFAIELVPLPGLAAAPVQAVLRRCFREFGIPDAILLDHGTPWWHPMPGHGWTSLTVFLLEQDIDVIYCGIRHPQTQGKVERFHRTLARRLRQWGVPTTHATFTTALARFRQEYNVIRPHEALGQRPPASHYVASRRRFTATPVPWTYDADHVVTPVNVNGAIHLDGRRYFVSHALAGRDVGCRHIGDRVLVCFRRHYVRELDLRTGRTVALSGSTQALAMS